MKVTDINVWENGLTSDEIALFQSQCLSPLHGSVVSWNDFKDAVLVAAAFEVPSDCDGWWLFFSNTNTYKAEYSYIKNT